MLRTWRQKLYERRLVRLLTRAERQLIDLEIEINRIGALDAVFKGQDPVGWQIRNRLSYLIKLQERYTQSFNSAIMTLERTKA